MKNTCMSDHAKKRTTSTRVRIDKDSLIKSLKAANAEQLELMNSFMARERSHMETVAKMVSYRTGSNITLTICSICGIPYNMESNFYNKHTVVCEGICGSCRDKLSHTVTT